MNEQTKREYVHAVCRSRGLLGDFDAAQEIAQRLLDTFAYDCDNFKPALLELIGRSKDDLHSMKALILLKSRFDELTGHTPRPLAEWHVSYSKTSFRRPRGRPSKAVYQQAVVSTMHELALDLIENLTRNLVVPHVGDQPNASYEAVSVADLVGVELGIKSIKTLGRMVTKYKPACGCYHCCPPPEEQEKFCPDESTWNEIREASARAETWLATSYKSSLYDHYFVDDAHE